MQIQQAQRVACLYFGNCSHAEVHLLKVAEACLRWTPQIAVSNEAIFLEVGKCRGLYREDWLALKLKALARRFGCEFRTAFAENVPLALAGARLGIAPRREDLPVESLVDYINPFGVDPETLSSVQEMAGTLRKLGILRLESFLAMPSRTLPSRFGKLGLLLHQRIREAGAIPWPRFMPPERVFEKVQFEISQPFHDLEPLFFALKPALDRAMTRLRGRCERASAVQIRLMLERYSSLSQDECSRSWRFDLALPQGASLGLIPVLRERMGFDLGQKPLLAPVVEMTFEVLETAPALGAQRDFFDAREEETEAWNALVARLVEKLGDEKIYMAEPLERYLPEKCWKRKEKASWVETDLDRDRDRDRDRDWNGGCDALPPRPLRILDVPLALSKSGEFLVHAGSSRTWRVRDAEGPEVLAGEWWFQQFQRSYYRVATESGELLWVFHTPGMDTLFLHGYFD